MIQETENPAWYHKGDGLETIDKIEAVTRGLDAMSAYCVGQIVRYVDRCGEKDAADVELRKANAYAHRLVTGEWPWEHAAPGEVEQKPENVPPTDDFSISDKGDFIEVCFALDADDIESRMLKELFGFDDSED